MSEAAESPLYVTPKEIAGELGMSTQAVLAWIHQGRLPAINVGIREDFPRWRVARNELQSFLAGLANQSKQLQGGQA